MTGPAKPLAGLLSAAVLAAVSACVPNSTPPSIDHLQLAPPNGVRAGEALQVLVDFQDEDCDLAGGHAEIALRALTEPTGDVFRVDLGEDTGERGKLTFTVTMPGGAIPGTYEVAVTVVDSVGRRSKSLAGEFDLIE